MVFENLKLLTYTHTLKYPYLHPPWVTHTHVLY